MITEGEDTISVYHAATRRCFYNGHVQHRHTVNAVLFDLDDTLFDHEQAARAALASVHRSHSPSTLWPFDAAERVRAHHGLVPFIREQEREGLVAARRAQRHDGIGPQRAAVRFPRVRRRTTILLALTAALIALLALPAAGSAAATR